jgi:hypothetical protein
VASKEQTPTSLEPPAKATALSIEERPLTKRERLYASGNRKRDNHAPKARDDRPRSRLYTKRER